VADIEVTRTGDVPMTFDVAVRERGSSSRHVVTLSPGDYHVERWSSPEDFVRACFEFLLEREPKESILARFDISDIGRYFPEFGRDALDPEA
jgi:hypothetical protein